MTTTEIQKKDEKREEKEEYIFNAWPNITFIIKAKTEEEADEKAFETTQALAEVIESFLWALLPPGVEVEALLDHELDVSDPNF